jgi:hypothetical protein
MAASMPRRRAATRRAAGSRPDPGERGTSRPHVRSDHAAPCLARRNSPHSGRHECARLVAPRPHTAANSQTSTFSSVRRCSGLTRRVSFSRVPGGPGRSLPPASHRSGPAGLPHTAPRVMGSLRDGTSNAPRRQAAAGIAPGAAPTTTMPCAYGSTADVTICARSAAPRNERPVIPKYAQCHRICPFSAACWTPIASWRCPRHHWDVARRARRSRVFMVFRWITDAPCCDFPQ